MQVKFNTEELQKVISQLAAVVSKKATSPVYEHVRLFAVPNGDKLAVAMVGVDIDASLTRYFTKAEATEALDVLLPYGKLSELVSNAASDTVVVEVEDETKAIYRSKKLRAVLRTFPMEQWPPIIDRPETVKAKVGLPGFKEQIANVVFAVPDEISKFVVSVAKVESTPETFRVIATDGFRLAISISKQNAGEFTLTIPKTALDQLAKLEGTELSILETEAGFYFETELEVLTVTRTSGEFPPYGRVMPKGYVSEVVLEKEALVKALKGVLVMADKEKPVIKINAIENGTALLLAATSTETTATDASAGMFTNTADDEIDARVLGPAIKTALNGRLLLEFLEHANGLITAKIGTENGIVDFFANGDSYRYLQMPAQAS